jgi:hypothetical protein
MADLLASLSAPPSGRATPIWFDSLGYCRAKLLAGQPVPWGSPGELAGFSGKAQGMFRSDAVLVDLANLFAWRVADDPELRAAMSSRSRPGYALRTLLADEQARAVAVDAVGVASGRGDATPVVLSMPSPARWLTVSAEQAGQHAAPPDPDRADTAAMFIADFLRIFATAPVDGLLLTESATAAADLIRPEVYRPVFNVTDHYEWPALVCTEAATAWPFGPVAGVAAWVGSAPPAQPAGTWGLFAGDDFWSGADAAGDPDVVLAVVPAQADPEAVMVRVRALI